MKKTLLPRISSPCGQPWSQMRGDDKRRFCEQCQLHVHNLDALSEGEKDELLAARGGRRCITYRNSDDVLRVPTRAWYLLRRLTRTWRAGLAFVVLVTGCATTSAPPPAAPGPTPTPTVQCASPQPSADDKQMLGGAIVMPEPLWKRILFFWRR